MANQERLEQLIRQGVEPWNQWRKENPKTYANLSGTDLKGADLKGADLSDADLSDADLSNADLSNADLSEAGLSEANLKGANFSRAYLKGANLFAADLSDADLSDADLSNADLSGTDLSEANLSEANLSGANLSGANLSEANLSGAYLKGADLRHAYLKGANLKDAEISETNLYQADLDGAELSNAKLSNANLSGAKLGEAILRDAILRDAELDGTYLADANLSGTDFRGASFYGADFSYAIVSDANFSDAILNGAILNRADLSGADLSGANLTAVQALNTNFEAATLTGACIEDWNINAATCLQDVICEYIFAGYAKEDGRFTNRIPHDPSKFFTPGDFAKLVQHSLNTINLIFREGLDWRSFAYSFQQLQVQYADEQIAIQAIENKGDGTIVVKLAAALGADKGSIEQSFWRGFELAEKKISGQYESRLEDKDKHINQLFILLQQQTEVQKLMAETPKYDLSGAKFGGGFAAEGGTQTGGTFNDFSQNIEQNINEIGGLIQSLRTLAEGFPAEQQNEALEHLGDLETDIQQPPEKRKPSRIKAALLGLLGVAATISGAVADTNEFLGQVQELSEKLHIPLPIEQVKPQAQQQDAIDVNASRAEQP